MYDDGKICDHYRTFTIMTATAICKEMGFAKAREWNVGYRWGIQYQFYVTMANIRCESTDWSSCAYTLGADHCHEYRDDVFLQCVVLSCPPGEFRFDGGCSSCPSNTYKAVEGTETFCTVCPDSSTSTEGSTYCSCKSGEFWTGVRCGRCPQGSSSQEGARQCTECPAGSTVLAWFVL